MSTTTFQQRVEPWLLACFGEQIAADTIERNHRFIEEALELVQACGCTQSEAHQLVDYVFGRPVGEIRQETGGVMVTLAALCRAQGISMHEAGETELARIWTKVEAIRAKQAAKPKHSPLPGPASALAQQAVPPDARDGINGPFNACMFREHCRSMLAAASAAPKVEPKGTDLDSALREIWRECHKLKGTTDGRRHSEAHALASWVMAKVSSLREAIAATPTQAPAPAHAEPHVWLYDFMDGATTVRNWSTTNKAEAFAPGNFNQRGYVPVGN